LSYQLLYSSLYSLAVVFGSKQVCVSYHLPLIYNSLSNKIKTSANTTSTWAWSKHWTGFLQNVNID